MWNERPHSSAPMATCYSHIQPHCQHLAGHCPWAVWASNQTHVLVCLFLYLKCPSWSPISQRTDSLWLHQVYVSINKPAIRMWFANYERSACLGDVVFQAQLYTLLLPCGLLGWGECPAGALQKGQVNRKVYRNKKLEGAFFFFFNLSDGSNSKCNLRLPIHKIKSENIRSSLCILLQNMVKMVCQSK